MVPLRPDVHCPHIGPSGGGMCDDDRTYVGNLEEVYFVNSPFLAPGLAHGNFTWDLLGVCEDAYVMIGCALKAFPEAWTRGVRCHATNVSTTLNYLTGFCVFASFGYWYSSSQIATEHRSTHSHCLFTIIKIFCLLPLVCKQSREKRREHLQTPTTVKDKLPSHTIKTSHTPCCKEQERPRKCNVRRRPKRPHEPIKTNSDDASFSCLPDLEINSNK